MNLNACAFFNGVQPGIPGVIPDIELWTLTSPVPGLMLRSTYARETIERALLAEALAD